MIRTDTTSQPPESVILPTYTGFIFINSKEVAHAQFEWNASGPKDDADRSATQHRRNPVDQSYFQ